LKGRAFADDDPPKAQQNGSARAHRTGREGGDQGQLTPVPATAGVADALGFAVARGITVLDPLVVPPGHDRSILLGQDGANGNAPFTPAPFGFGAGRIDKTLHRAAIDHTSVPLAQAWRRDRALAVGMTQDNLTQWDPASHGVAEIVAALDLQPHPEGGWYRETFRSALKVRRADGAQRDAFTQILFLLGPGEISRWHRVNHADESWCCLAGDPLALLILGSGPEGLQEWRLQPGSAQSLVVPAGVWQAARALGRWSLMTCAVAPGFDFADFQLLSELSAAEHPPAALPEYR